MDINSTVIPARTIDEYDISFSSGYLMTITVCKDDGDTVDFDTHPGAVIFHLSARKSIDQNIKDEVPAEDITLFTNHILAIKHSTRKTKPVNAEQHAAWQQTIRSFTTTSKTIQ